MPEDILYRVIDPDHRGPDGPQPIAFEDPLKSYEAQSFFVARIASPSKAMKALSPFSRARKVCNTGRRPPSPDEMFEAGFRVARISAKVVLDAIEGTRSGKRPLSIQKTGEDDFDERGHLNLFNGRFHSGFLADNSIQLSREETL